jgi:hypothetical protein
MQIEGGLKTSGNGLRTTRMLGTVALCGLLLAGAIMPVYAAEVIDRVLAVAAGNLILLSDVNAARDLHLLTVPPGADPIAVILPQLIDRALILGEVERYAPPEPGEDAVNARLESVRATFPSRQSFEQALARVGADEKHLRETLRQDARILLYLDQRFTVQPPNEQDLDRYFREHADRFTRDGRLTPFEQARPQVIEQATAERRQRLVDDWVAGLRRRVEILDLTTPLR